MWDGPKQAWWRALFRGLSYFRVDLCVAYLGQVARQLQRVLGRERAQHLSAPQVALPLALALGQHVLQQQSDRVGRPATKQVLTLRVFASVVVV